MDEEDQVRRHYGRAGLEQAILQALADAGRDVTHLRHTDLSGADEFHLGWYEATRLIARDLGLVPGMTVLDLGSGLGGPARTFAALHGCQVTGIDITPDYVDTATALTRRCRLDHLVRFDLGSILALPYADAGFDRASLIHVGMNIADKPSLFAEARRVLKPGGRLAVYDAMLLSREALTYPMPWADSADASFIAPVADYRRALAAAGFAVEAEHDRSDMVLALAREQRADADVDGPPALSLHMLMSPVTRPGLANVMDALARGIIAPIALLARAA